MVTEGAYGQLKGRWPVLESACEILWSTIEASALPKKLDLTFDLATNEKRNREKIREVLQMRNCAKVRDSSAQAGKIRAALTEKLWLEKKTGQIC